MGGRFKLLAQLTHKGGNTMAEERYQCSGCEEWFHPDDVKHEGKNHMSVDRTGLCIDCLKLVPSYKVRKYHNNGTVTIDVNTFQKMQELIISVFEDTEYNGMAEENDQLHGILHQGDINYFHEFLKGTI
jgi:hypothetical protein